MPTPGRHCSLCYAAVHLQSVRKILLDFDGHTTINTAWNSIRRSTITTPPYDTDGSPGFSAAEKANMVAIWRAVADSATWQSSEDFAAFDVDVTTEDPGGWGWLML
jgi:hypothetical protein